MYSDPKNIFFTFITFTSNPGISVLPVKGEGKTAESCKLGPNLEDVHFT